jgi:hypothetical protein
MPTKTITIDPEVMTATALDSEFRRLAHLAGAGDNAAEKQLVKIEARIEDLHRTERRQVAAALEVQRLAGEAAEKTAADAQLAHEREHAKFLGQREEVFVEIETLTGELAREVALALALDEELWASSLRCGWSPEQRTKSRITDYIATRLGREGSGLDMPSIYGPLRESSLVRQHAKES